MAISFTNKRTGSVFEDQEDRGSEKEGTFDLLLDDPLNAIQAHFQGRQCGTVAETDEVVAGRVEEVAAFGWVEVEEDAWDDCLGGKKRERRVSREVLSSKKEKARE